jgi:SAM-dependent methyltransferase
MSVACRLCGSAACSEFARLDRLYWRCGACDLVFVDAQDLPSAGRELNEYRLHDNDVHDPGYRGFLGQLVDPVLHYIDMRGGCRRVRVLDFGSGPAPALQAMLVEADIATEVFDPFFAPDISRLRSPFDVITCTETVEHFHEPGRAFATLKSLLAPSGRLAIMTQLRPRDEAQFASWHYRRDITHVALYSLKTMTWIARQFGWLHTPHSARVHFFDDLQKKALP